jgi:DNA-binding NtrC family response regulator
MDRTVFVVDDERLLTDTVAAILRTGGYGVRAFYHPGDVLRAAAEAAPDLLISDFNMPEINGVQLASQVVAMHKDCRVIIMSGVVSTIGLHDLSGEFRFLQKPILPAVLLQEVKAALEL